MRSNAGSGESIPTSDVQNRYLNNGYKLTKVGVTGVKKPVTV
ncbi:MAG: GTP cyclohydrolase I FolE2, partial [Methanomassiliicoccales archaeon]|nr:GTP cyclohydrolase I FolE2 [Methanomassiliicoccales archaeon]